MAQVPYNPVPNALEPAGRPEPEGPRVDTPPAAFGVNIGQAVTQGGQQVGQVGNELFARALEIQGLQNETTARNQSIAATQKMAERYAQYNSLGEQEKSAALPGLLKDLNTIRLQGRAGLNQMAARMYDPEVANLQNSFTRYGAIQAGEAVKKATFETAKAHEGIIADTIVDAFDDKEFNKKKEQVTAAVLTQVKNSPGGFSQDIYDHALQESLSKLTAKRIVQQSLKNIDVAFNSLDEAVENKQITQTDADALTLRLRNENQKQNGHALAMAIYSPNKTNEQMDNEFEAKWRDYAHGDPDFRNAAYNQFKSMVGNNRWTEQQDIYKAEQVLMKGVQSGKYKTQAEMEADPQSGPAFKAALSVVAGTKFDLPGELNTFNRQRNLVTNQTNYTTLLGMATSQDPKLRQEFLKKDLIKENLSQSDLGKLLLKRERMIGGDHGLDPQVRAAYQNLSQLYGDAIPSPRAGNRYTEFLGLIHEDLEEWQAREMPLPTTVEEYKKFGQGIMNKVPGTGYIWDSPIFQASPPKDFRAHYREMGWDDRAIELQYRRSLAAQTFNKLFSGVESGGQ